VLAVPPRVGWLSWETERGVLTMPVVPTGASKTKWNGSAWVDVELTVVGVDVGTAGKGAHFEADPVIVALPGIHRTTIDVGGGIDTPPLITIVGPAPHGGELVLGNYALSLRQDLQLGEFVVVNSAAKTVTLNGVPSRSAVTFARNAWPVMQVGAVECRTQLGPEGRALIEMVPLW
jgi:hypothetical protein